MAKEVFKESSAMSANLLFLAKIHGMDRKKLATVMGISETVFYNRMNAPETFRLEELERLAAWSTKRGYPVTLAQMCKPFVPAKIDAAEVPA